MTMNLRRHGRVLALGMGLLLGGTVVTVPAVAMAQYTPRDDLRNAYEQAKAQFNNLELEAAQRTLEAAIGRAQQYGMANDPALAPLLTLRAGIIYSIAGDRAAAVMAFGDAVRADYYASIPIELRSEELQSMLDEARALVGSPPQGEPVSHQAPPPNPGQDLWFIAKMNMPMLEGFQAALYWRFTGEQNYRSVSMDTFGNLATAVLPVGTHQNRNLEYAIYAFDAEQRALANKGATDAPLQVLFNPTQTAEPVAPTQEPAADKPEKEKKKKKRPKAGPLPRIFLNFGAGTGLGIARGTAELTYEQFFTGQDATYGRAEQVCAMMRFYYADGQLPSPNDAREDLNNPGLSTVFDADYRRANPADQLVLLSGAYNKDACGRRHPVATGTASAPFHLQPEFGVRVADNVVLSVYGRLQLVTGSLVWRGDDPEPSAPAVDHFNNTIRSREPVGVRDRPPFTWAVGLKAKYFFMKGYRFRVYAGGFLGGGFSRLMVNMGFANDRNGNSIPDDRERSQFTAANGDCFDVWPYQASCTLTDEDIAAGVGDDAGLAAAVSSRAVTADGIITDPRRDTVVLGPVFAGGLFGFNWQLHKNFALFAEVQAGGWFWQTSSVLFDFNLGPAVTF